MREWINPGRYVSGRELAAAGMAELVELDQLHRLPFERLPKASRPSRMARALSTGPATGESTRATPTATLTA